MDGANTEKPGGVFQTLKIGMVVNCGDGGGFSRILTLNTLLV